MPAAHVGRVSASWADRSSPWVSYGIRGGFDRPGGTTLVNKLNTNTKFTNTKLAELTIVFYREIPEVACSIGSKTLLEGWFLHHRRACRRSFAMRRGRARAARYFRFADTGGQPPIRACGAGCKVLWAGHGAAAQGWQGKPARGVPDDLRAALHAQRCLAGGQGANACVMRQAGKFVTTSGVAVLQHMWPSHGAAMGRGASALEVLQLVLDAVPFVGVFGRLLGAVDGG